jgi:O-antigen/teichoic acid export membrane protein
VESPYRLILAVCGMAFIVALAGLTQGRVALAAGALVVAGALALLARRTRAWKLPRRPPAPWMRAHPRRATVLTASWAAVALFPAYYMICSGVWWIALPIDALASTYVARRYSRYIRTYSGDSGAAG